LLAMRAKVDAGKLRQPADNAYEVEAVLADGSVFPHKGRITFTDAEFNQQTGTYLLRATLPNPEARLKPGQFVRARVSGNVRPNAILIPQKAVMQGAQGHFVFVVIDGKAQARPVKAGEWHGADWFIEEGLEAGDVVITEGMMKVAPGADVKVTQAPAAGRAIPAATPAAPSTPASGPAPARR
ncbi:MAG: efflux RND transporter periplasmic adaptor subunit, partial [Methylobacterium sp.]|nr:efflux RND transporter periplasmic adaptor subunit [Methylobacterium sp.]